MCERKLYSFTDAEQDTAWRAAVMEEMEVVEQSDTWEFVDLPRNHRRIWVIKLKKNEFSAVIKHKARLVAKGYVQQPGVNFDGLFAPVVCLKFVCLLLSFNAHEGWHVHHMDVKSAFRNGVLEEEVYVSQPPGFVVTGEEGKVLRLMKALYGLRQAPRALNARLDAALKSLGFGTSAHEHGVYGHGHGRVCQLIGVYINDLVAQRSIHAFPFF